MSVEKMSAIWPATASVSRAASVAANSELRDLRRSHQDAPLERRGFFGDAKAVAMRLVTISTMHAGVE